MTGRYINDVYLPASLRMNHLLLFVQFWPQLHEHVPLHPPSHVPEQRPEHVFWQPAAQVQLSDAFIMLGTLASTIAPRIGRAPLAAFLKNSRRVWSSSFFLLLCIIIWCCAYRLPEIQRFTLQEDVGVCTVVHILFHLQPMQWSRHKEWRGHPYALNLRSAREKLELLPNI